MPPTDTIIANDVTRRIFRGLVYSPLMKNMMRTSFDSTFHINCSNHALGNDMLDLVTVACNNDDTIRQQYRLLNSYLADPFCYTVADNSSIPLKQQAILDVCRKSNIAYIRLPSNPLTMTVFRSFSHGMALNWVYYKYVKPRASLYFGFLDHDIYPVKRSSIINILESQPVFGFRQPSPDRDTKVWYLYPGFCFFQRDITLGKRMDFTPDKGFDTGFSNWHCIYSKIDPATIEFPNVSMQKLNDGNKYHASFYWMIGDWIHSCNASNWSGLAPHEVTNKEKAIEMVLEQYYKRQ